MCSWPSEKRSGSRKYSTSSRQSCGEGCTASRWGKFARAAAMLRGGGSLKDLCDVVHRASVLIPRVSCLDPSERRVSYRGPTAAFRIVAASLAKANACK